MQLRSFVYSVLLSRAKEPVLVRAAAAIYWRSRMPHPLNPPLLPSPSFTPSNLRTATCVCDTQKTVILSGCCIYNVHCCLYFNTTASLLFFVALNNIHKSCSKLAKKKKKKPCDSTHLCPLCSYFNIFMSVVLSESLWGMVSTKKLNFFNVWACILEFKLAYCSSTYLKLYICNSFTGCKLRHEDPGFAWNLPSIKLESVAQFALLPDTFPDTTPPI